MGALWFASVRGRRAREASRAPEAAPPARQPAKVAAIPLAPPKGPPSTDADFRKAYLMLIAALDEGLERGEFSRETHALIRQNLKRRLQALLAEEPASGIR